MLKWNGLVLKSAFWNPIFLSDTIDCKLYKITYWYESWNFVNNDKTMESDGSFMS